MAEYIERDRLYELGYWHGATPTPDNPFPDGVDAVDTKDIDSVPAADVVPVRHGRWVKAKGAWCTPGGDPVWECSECGKGIHVYGIEHGTYGASVADGQWVACPNCGARMEVSHE